MPSTKKVEHNGVLMTFTEDDHSYVDSRNRTYTSVTTLVSQGFRQFDAEGIARKKAGENWKDLVLEWRKIGEEAAYRGTRLHENCEAQILGHPERMHSPESIAEKMNFDAAFKAVESIKSDSSFVSFEPEKLVFAPQARVAGSVDLLAKKKDGSYTIFDWKCVKSIDEKSFGGRTGIIEATATIPDSNYWHYALQLSLYEIILKLNGYVPVDALFNRCLNVISSGTYQKIELPDLKEAGKRLIIWLNNR